jgi:hypothetical protein
MRTRKRKGEAEAVDPLSTVNHEPTTDQLCNILKEKKGKKITKEFRERIETFIPIEQAGVKQKEIPKIEEEEQPRKKWILSKMTDEEKEMLWARNEWIREQRHNASIEKILKKMGQNKYAGFIGQKININGMLHEVKPIVRKQDQGRKSKAGNQ